MTDIIARIDALLANTPPSEIEEFEVCRCLRDAKADIERLRSRVVRLPWTRGDWAGTVDMIAYRGMVAEALDAAGVKWEMEDG